MAFTGTATITQISDSIVRITGLSLAAGASGTIGLFPATGTAPGAKTPQAFQPAVYEYGATSVALSDSIDVTTKPAATGVATAIPISVVKSGTTTADWRATLTNTSATDSPALEIYVRFHN